jgi:hypothetical protein
MKALLIVLAMLGCKDTDDKALNEWVVKDAKKSIAKLKAALRSAQTSTSIVECGQMANMAVLEKQDRAVADELRQLCNIDIHIAVMTTQIDAIEAKRKTRPKDELGIDCIDPFYEHAKDEMTKAGTLDAAKATIARYDALCPPVKK